MKDLILLVGPPGSGKFLPGYLHLCTDNGAINKKFKEGLAAGRDIVIDRLNPNKVQRARYIGPALQAGYTVRALVFQTTKAECLNRLRLRSEHPTLDNSNPGKFHIVLSYFYKEYQEVDEIPVTFV